MIAFAETEDLAVRWIIKPLGYDPLRAGHGLIELSNCFDEQGGSRFTSRARVNKALHFEV
jgi:hypothetical protein